MESEMQRLLRQSKLMGDEGSEALERSFDAILTRDDRLHTKEDLKTKPRQSQIILNKYVTE